MVLIKEYRVVLPCSVEEYQVGQLFSVAEASKNETGGGEGIEVLRNEPYEKEGEKGQYTHKIYRLKSRVPTFIQLLAPESAFVFHEKAWNAYPYCRTGECSSRCLLFLYASDYFLNDYLGSQCSLYFNVANVMFLFSSPPAYPWSEVTNEYMKDNFLIKIETWHKPDLGTQENVHKLDRSSWQQVTVVPIDIADGSQVCASDYKQDEDPAKFKSVKTGRGPLGPFWKKELGAKNDCPRMCAYKLVTVKFKWFGLQTRVENLIHEQEKRIFTNFHRQLFCWIDKWVELTMDDIRRMEAETQKELDELRKKGDVRGTSAADE
ncbi:phosphatidylinositol transfer protein beta isoform-like [Corythoichthys intestinalis]|uniref:phosphatidylinositol transfer protein beta isoform-like n=1 Tax=Corythoichthys intestinalis TaxID=161448 RepID=UPI0025A623CC|nr:phosphatidylinositol transfer protein beta isoform-like [Corythoichthys intestinalis]